LVKVVYLEDAPDGSKRGVDDYLAAGGTVKEMLMLARKFEPADLGRIRLSRDEQLRLTMEDLERRFWAEEWKGMGGHSDRDVALKLMEAAARHGKNHPDGIRVVKAWGPLMLEAKVSRRTLSKALNRLEERGLLYRDNEGREADKTGAFVLRASVDHKGGSTASGGKVTRPLQRSVPGGLHLRAPRLMWSSPEFKPKRGTVKGTRKVRQGPPREPRPAVKRLGKIRGTILDALDANGGTMHVNELADALHRRRARDLRRRNLPMLEEARIIEVDGDTVVLADDWLDRLEEQRELGGETEAEEVSRRRYEDRRRAYHNRHKTEPDHHFANLGADGYIEDLAPADTPEPELSPLAAALEIYLERNPGDRNQPESWIAITLWAHDLYPGKPTREEVAAALEELRPKRRAA
jgi:DNA-binding transcriptional ArsR family regulator